MEYSLNKLTFNYKEYKNISISLIGKYQLKNAAVVLTVIDTLKNKSWNINNEAIKNGLLKAKWPARFEILSTNPVFIFDGGHNSQGVESAMHSFQMHFINKKAIFILGIMADKNIEEMLKILIPNAKEIITVTPNNPRTLSAALLKERIEKFNVPVCYSDSIPEAIEMAHNKAESDDVVFAIGSLYMYNDVVNAFEQYHNMTQELFSTKNIEKNQKLFKCQ